MDTTIYDDIKLLKRKNNPNHVVVCIDIGSSLCKIALLNAMDGRLLVRRLFETRALLASKKLACQSILKAVLRTGEAVIANVASVSSFSDFHHIMLATPGYLKEKGQISLPPDSFKMFDSNWVGRFDPHVVLFGLPKGKASELKETTKAFRKQDRKSSQTVTEIRVVCIQRPKFTCMNTRAAGGYAYRDRHHFEDGLVITLGQGAGLTLVALERVDVSRVASYEVWLDDKSFRDSLSASALNALPSDAARSERVLEAARACVKHANSHAPDLCRRKFLIEVCGGMARRLDAAMLADADALSDEERAQGKSARISVLDADECIWNDTRGLQAFFRGTMCFKHLRGEERYIEQSFVARGAFGSVVRAYDRVLCDVVAIKRMAGESADDAEIGKMERDMLVKLGEHPYVSAIIDAYIDDNEDMRRFCLVMPFYPRSLKDEMKESVDGGSGGALSDDRVMQVSRCVLSALAYVHHQGVVHRDLKPGNVLCEQDGKALLGDFGVAAMASDTPQQVGGTSLYLSPECVKARDVAVRAAQDMWAFGVMLVQLCDGKHPYEEMDEDVAVDLIELGVNEKKTPIRDAFRRDRDACADAIAEMVRAVLFVDWKKRASAEELSKNYIKKNG